MAKTQLIKLLDLPGIQSLEDIARCYGTNSQRFDTAWRETCQSLFSTHPFQVERGDERWKPFELGLRVETKKRPIVLKSETFAMAEDMAEYLRRYGYDLTDRRGIPLEITKKVALTIEAIVKGVIGKQPDLEKAAAERWGQSLIAERKRNE